MEYVTLSYENEDESTALETCEDLSKIRTCQACGKQFVYKRGQQKFCTRVHYKICVVCGKEFIVDLTRGIDHLNQTCSRDCANVLTSKSVSRYAAAHPVEKKEFSAPIFKTLSCEFCGKEFEVDNHVERKYCSDDCRRKARRLKFQSTTRVCVLCGKEFHPVNTRNYICSDTHYRPCPVCGKPVEVKYAYDSLRVCSPKCKEKLKRRTCQERYGVDVASQSSDARKRLHDRMVEIEPLKQKKLFALYGVKNVAQIPEVRDKIARTVKSVHCQDQTRQTTIERFGVPYAMQSRELLLKQTESARHTVASDGRPLDSSYEKLVYEFCIRNNIKLDMQIPIEFDYEGKKHVTFIDFMIDGILFEVKGSHLLHGLYDDEHVVPISRKLELYRENHVVVITDKYGSDIFGKPNSFQSNGLKYLNKCPNPLIGVDIKLFDNPSFPYRDDRPPAFYQTRVNGQQSSVDAFNDESIRWKMIMNRILYSGGFIDGNQVLTAMNVSRVCKQPSWFSKSFAKSIIQKYVTTSVVVDPFAGWGTRHDAAIELRKQYVGCDLNEDLVTWHQLQGRDIRFGDAKQFKYSGECSVFICPPYQDIETYFEGQDIGLTQCQWLQVVMKNVPNAKEYIMVCKVVDSGFEQYIVDTKVNRSHFGVNNEYIIVIHNS